MPPPSVVFAAIIFGSIGFGAWRYGKNMGQWRPMVIGVGLMLYPYFVDGAWLLWGIGIALTAALYIFRET